MKPLDKELAELFVDLQTSGIWEDEKYISDAELLAPSAEVLSAYRQEKQRADFDLKDFFYRYFIPVQTQDVDFKHDPSRSPEEHIKALWPFLQRPADKPERPSSRFALPYSYLVPGGRFQEVYYWDSYFTQLGLVKHGYRHWVSDILDNFAYFIKEVGHIPNGNRSYFLSRSQPPFFAHMVHTYAQAADEPIDIYEKYIPALEAEYSFWASEIRNKDGFTHYWDAGNTPRIEMYRTDLEWEEHTQSHPDFFQHLRAACESGWDFSSRWMKDPMDLGTTRTMDVAPVDLNSLLFYMEELLYNLTGKPVYAQAASKRKRKIQDVFFTENGYQDIVISTGAPTGVLSAACCFPLFVGAASQEQADFTARQIADQLLQQGGLATTLNESGQQWDAPNGWAPLQWVAVQGLAKYGHVKLAQEIAKRWLQTCDIIYTAKGKFVEKYNVFEPDNLSKGGEYKVQDGFGWSNGVYVALLHWLEEQGAN